MTSGQYHFAPFDIARLKYMFRGNFLYMSFQTPACLASTSENEDRPS